MTLFPFAALISQQNRLIEISTALPDAALLVERFIGHESVSQPFLFEIDCLSAHAHFDLNALIGEEITLRLQLADGAHRCWHGYVTQALQLGSDGGFARYRLNVAPWLALLKHRRNCYLFQDVDIRTALDRILSNYPQADWRIDVSQTLRTHSRLTQYRETDLAFIQRVLSAEGLSYRFEHDQSAAAGDNATHARHKLVVFDRNAERPICIQPTIRFHRADATEITDSVQRIHETRQILTNKVSLSGWDYKQLTAPGGEASSTQNNNEVPPLEIYDGSAAYPFESRQAATQRSDALLAAHESRFQRLEGTGSARAMAVASTFTLTGHDQYPSGRNTFTALAISHQAANNLGANMARLLKSPDIEAGSYRNQFDAQAYAQPIVPLPCPKPYVAPQSAQVVGHDDAPLSTDRDHRIKVQFHWQRGDTPNPGGLSAPTQGITSSASAAPSAGSEKSERRAGSNAPGDETSGSWIRVAEWLAGANWGSHFLPRIGTEVLVEFIGGDIDRPVIVGQTFTGEELPPFSAGHDSGANHPGVISGWMSHNHDAGFNQWLADDAPGQLHTRLATSRADSQLGLGHLIHHHPLTATRGPWRGSGFELRTDGWLAVRAGEGMLLSSTARSNATSSQLDVSEAVAQLRAAECTAKTLSDAAAGQGAHPLAANTQQTRFIDGIDPAKDGKFTSSVGGQTAQKAQPASRTLGEPTERFAEPVIVAEAPDDIGLTSPASTVFFAAEHLHATVQHDWHSAAAHTLSTTVGEAASWFSHADGIKTVAAAGRHTIQAHTDAMAVHADKAVTVTSTSDEIRILAKDQIQIKAGQSAVTLSGGDITFACPGTFSVKGGGNAFQGPGRGSASLYGLPMGTVVEVPHWIEVERKYYDGSAVQGAPVEITFAGGTIRTARLNEAGFARVEGTPGGLAEIEIGEDARSWTLDDSAQPQANPAYGKRLSEEQAVALFELYTREIV
ncbi:type VI secretion system Vgr family protein [Denitromonas halophila]|uniref:Type VI secretion system tip protein VgrG n=1 Tax=Denitromonas halophila TaxID=1629404 RepID=A0A557QKE2_9RHOO|nr:type VI secretion system Vgr family protein [Denitromonas halophila]TVO53372.1 type VI secretion system tip protein VgrG [Denitromonas halophila]